MNQNPETQLAVGSGGVKQLLALPAYKDRFAEVLGKRAPQFMAAIASASSLPQLRDAEPRSVIAAAMVAATLDLPINPALGQAHIVAYKGQAQFQMGYKGFIQLAQRSGKYRRLNAGPANAEVFKGYDMMGEPVLDFSKLDPLAPVGGYFAGFETLNGFTKMVWWTKAQVEAHAKRFSAAYKNGYKSSPWFSDFDSMAVKTVIKQALTKWGVMSVEMQTAAIADQGVVSDIGAEPVYADRPDEIPGDPVTRRAVPAKGIAAMKQAVPVSEPETISAQAESVPATMTDSGAGSGAGSAPSAAAPEETHPPVPQPEGWPKKIEGVILSATPVEMTTEAAVATADGVTPAVKKPTHLLEVSSPESGASGLGDEGKPCKLVASPWLKAIAEFGKPTNFTIERWPSKTKPGQNINVVVAMEVVK